LRKKKLSDNFSSNFTPNVIAWWSYLSWELNTTNEKDLIIKRNKKTLKLKVKGGLHKYNYLNIYNCFTLETNFNKKDLTIIKEIFLNKYNINVLIYLKFLKIKNNVYIGHPNMLFGDFIELISKKSLFIQKELSNILNE